MAYQSKRQQKETEQLIAKLQEDNDFLNRINTLLEQRLAIQDKVHGAQMEVAKLIYDMRRIKGSTQILLSNFQKSDWQAMKEFPLPVCQN